MEIIYDDIANEIREEFFKLPISLMVKHGIMHIGDSDHSENDERNKDCSSIPTQKLADMD